MSELSLRKEDSKRTEVEEKLKMLPTRPGVYKFLNADGKVLYVGKAQNLRSRVRQYFHPSRKTDPRINAMIEKIASIDITVTDTEVEALILESNLIKELKPRYNVVLKDDKSYPYIVITDEPFPRVFVTRRKQTGNAQYFGPYTDVRTMRSALKTVRSVFMIRSCNYDLTEETISKRKYKLCLDYHIKKCGGPCEGLVTSEEYTTMIKQVANVLRGKTKPVREYLQKLMERMAEELRYEEAAIYRDKIQQLNVYEEKQKVVDSKQRDRDIFAIVVEDEDACCVLFKARDGKIVGSRHFYISNTQQYAISIVLEQFLQQYYLEAEDYPDYLLVDSDIESKRVLEEWLAEKSGHKVMVVFPQEEEDKNIITLAQKNALYYLHEYKLQKSKWSEFVPPSVKMLQSDLQLPHLPRRIECFDVSTLQGSDTVASMVVFVDGKSKKSEYRKFSIQTIEGQDDFASMREVIERRYKNCSDENKPQLIVVDGGKGQLNAAYSVLKALGIEIPIIGLAKRLEEIFIPHQSEPILLSKTSASLKLLQRIRDEAHRFAIQYHRVKRSKRLLRSELDLIKGIGTKRAQLLLEVFGSVQGVRFASQEQLAEVVGEALAAKIKEFFSEQENTTAHLEEQ